MVEHRFLEQIPAYVLGCLSSADRNQLEEHVREGCDLCEPELFSLGETAARLSFALPNKPLPPTLKERIRKRIEAEAPIVKSRTPSIARSFLIAASIAAFAFLLFILWSQQVKLAEREKTIAELKQMTQHQQQEISWLRDPSVQLALLTGLKPAPNAKGKMVWNPKLSQGIFYANFLPSLQEGKSYQLWVIGNKGPVSAGVFEPDPAGSAVVTISRIQGAAEGTLQFAVTIEPHGGVPQPTGSMILAGKPL
jgi:anti-sigma-K factor RskA